MKSPMRLLVTLLALPCAAFAQSTVEVSSASQLQSAVNNANSGGGNVIIVNGGALAQTATIDAGGGNLSLATGAGQLSLGGTLNAGAGKTVSLTGAGGISLTAALTTNASTSLDTLGSTYTDGGFKLSTGNHALSVTTGGLAVTAATTFDSGTAGTTIAASAGSALSAGNGVAGGLHLSETDLNRVTAAPATPWPSRPPAPPASSFSVPARRRLAAPCSSTPQTSSARSRAASSPRGP